MLHGVSGVAIVAEARTCVMWRREHASTEARTCESMRQRYTIALTEGMESYSIAKLNKSTAKLNTCLEAALQLFFWTPSNEDAYILLAISMRICC